MRHAVEMLERFGVPHERHIVSAHRTPAWMTEFARAPKGAASRSSSPAPAARRTCRAWSPRRPSCRCSAFRSRAPRCKGLDSLLSIVQMPGGVPVGTLAIGKAGATNAALLAVSILANSRPRPAGEAPRVPTRSRPGDVRAGTAAVTRVIAPGGAARRARRRSARTHVRHRRAAHGLPRPHLLAGRRHADRPGRRSSRSRASYEDLDALRAFARGVDVVTFEFENVPDRGRSTRCEELAPVRPVGRGAAHRAAARAREDVPRRSRRARRRRSRRRPRSTSCGTRSRSVGTPAVIKTAAFGYDGKGQHKVDHAGRRRAQSGPRSATRRRSSRSSSTCRRRSRSSRRAGSTARSRRIAPFENRHRNHILDVTTAPAAIPPAWRSRRREIARTILEELQYVGVLCVEFFVSTDGELLVNELAPRPHNSGHLTFDAARHQPVRAAGAGDLRPAARLDGHCCGRPRWRTCSATCGWTASRTGRRRARFTDVKLHLYGKDGPRPAARWATSRRSARRCRTHRTASSPRATRC